TVNLTYTGTASNGTDYTGVVSVTIPAGATNATFNLATIDDALADSGETIIVSLGSISGGGFEAIAANPSSNSVTTTISDEATPDTVLVSIAGPASVTEGATTTNYTVSLGQAAATPVTVNLTYTGTATNGSDYTGVVSVTIPAGATNATFNLATIDDALADSGETIIVSLGSITGGGFEAIAANPSGNSVTTTISDEATPDTVLVSITGPSSVIEGAATGNFTVSLGQAAATPVTVNLTYTGTATNGTDYTGVVSITIPAGANSATFNLATIDDALADSGETIIVSLGSITGGGFEAIAANPAANSVTTTISDEATPDTVLVSITGPATVTEGNATGNYTVSLGQAAATAVTVNLTYTGTASNGTDYTGVVSVTVPAGATNATFNLATLDDALADSGETIIVSLGSITGGGFEAIAANPAANSVTTTISDEATPDTVLVSIAGPATVVEGNATTNYTVSLGQAAVTPVTVNLTYTGTATNGSDYTGVVSVTVPAGATSATFTIPTIDDARADSGETIIVSLGSISGGGFEAIAANPSGNSVTTTINDEAIPDTVLVGITGPATVTEGNTTGNYTITLGQAAFTPVTVNLTYTGTATNGTDYTGVISVTVPAGATTATFNLATLDDAFADSGETIIVSLGSITGGGFEAIAANPSSNSVTTTISDEATPDTVLVSIAGPATVTEGNTTGNFTVSLGQAAVTPVTVNLTYTGTATNGTDYTGVVSVTIPAGATNATFNIATLDDALADSGETIVVSLGSISGGGFEAIAANPSSSSVTTTISDEATPDTVLVSIAGPATVTEGNTTGNYTISLGQAAVTPVTVNLTYTGTAANGTDYTGVVSVTVPAGATSATFNLATIDDAFADSGETIVVSLGSISGGGFEAITAHPTNNSVTTTISDEATPDTVLVSIAGPASVTEGNNTGNYTVSLAQAAVTPVTVNLTYTGTAANGTDYTSVISVTIPAGATSTTFNLATLDDAFADSGETIIVSLGSISGGGFEAIAANPSSSSVTTTINDEATPDTVLVSIAGPASVIEGNATSNYTVSLGQAAVTPVTVNLTYTGTATNGSDYTGVISVTVPAGATSATFTIPTIDDARADSGETIIVSLGSISGGGFEAIAANPASNSVTTTISDEATPDTVLVSITGPSSVIEGAATGNFTVSLG
ncbi:immunoglobulin-like domain-containing protein, partial [Uliginosibacterium sp. H3]|nr:immunoglobulin-like domain-containing protein [Uliginosibacterium sp. H3]